VRVPYTIKRALTLALSQRAREKRNFNPKPVVSYVEPSEIQNKRSFA
jgi:hypothetical protein